MVVVSCLLTPFFVTLVVVGNDSDVHSRCGTNYMSSGLGEASMI